MTLLVSYRPLAQLLINAIGAPGIRRTRQSARLRGRWVAPEHHYSEDDQTPVKLRQAPQKVAMERAPDAVGGYCILRYTPGPQGYVSIVVVKRAGENDKASSGCCVQSADDALLPSKPSSETLLEFAGEGSPAAAAAC